MIGVLSVFTTDVLSLRARRYEIWYLDVWVKEHQQNQRLPFSELAKLAIATELVRGTKIARDKLEWVNRTMTNFMGLRKLHHEMGI